MVSGLPDIATRRLKSFAANDDLLIRVVDTDPAHEQLKDAGNGLMRIGVHHKGAYAEATFSRNGNEMHSRDVIEARAALLTLQHFRDTAPNSFNPSEKERAYLAFVAEGLSDQQIADELNLSLRAVRERKKKLLTNTGSRTVAHALSRYLDSLN